MTRDAAYRAQGKIDASIRAAHRLRSGKADGGGAMPEKERLAHWIAFGRMTTPPVGSRGNINRE